MNTEYSSVPDETELPARPTIQDGCAFLQMDARTVRNRIADRSIKAYRLGPRAIRLDRDSLIAFASQPLVMPAGD